MEIKGCSILQKYPYPFFILLGPYFMVNYVFDAFENFYKIEV